MTNNLDSMYQEIILDYYRNPSHRGELADFDGQSHQVNPTCGDEVTLQIRLVNGVIADLGWVGQGCAISQASISVMSELVVGHRTADAFDLAETFRELMQSQGHSDLTEQQRQQLADAVAFEGVAKFPARVKCALLGWMAMKSAVADASRSEQP